MIFLVQILGNGVLIGLVYSVLGLGIVVVYKASEAFNFAVGQFLVIGSYLFYLFFAGLGLPFPAAFPLGILAAGIVGAVVERLAVKPLMGRDPVLTTKMTLGLMFLLSALTQFVLGATGSPGWRPLNLPVLAVETADLLFLSEQIWAGILSLLTFGLVVAFLRRTRWGLAIRAVSESQTRASAFGINAHFVLLITWAVSAGCIAVAGIMISNFGILSTSSATVGFRAIPVALIGGMDSVPGALVAGIAIGIFETLVATTIEPLGLIGFKDVAVYILILTMLFIRPHGLFGTVRIERV
ncbi:MAG: branched-chain amino acid ABC transporter permease [Proteobacteria bacterium]|nr:branched-chain amino acid ABC transporter permease [Pseudomonadota bacterium]